MTTFTFVTIAYLIPLCIGLAFTFLTVRNTVRNNVGVTTNSDVLWMVALNLFPVVNWVVIGLVIVFKIEDVIRAPMLEAFNNWLNQPVKKKSQPKE